MIDTLTAAQDFIQRNPVKTPENKNEFEQSLTLIIAAVYGKKYRLVRLHDFRARCYEYINKKRSFEGCETPEQISDKTVRDVLTFLEVNLEEFTQ